MLTNGAGEPRIPIDQVKPGTIARFGVDDDMTVLVVANFESVSRHQYGDKQVRRLIMFGCFCDEPGPFDANRGQRPYEEGRLMDHDFGMNETMTVLLVPE